jgi:NAD(P)-dependent dehydrogenase (short-subunit alcohol dehydrogenase family)
MSAGGQLDGRTAIVTGGGAGIGGGISRLFAAEGAHVVLNEIDPDLADAARTDIEAAGGAVTLVVGDIRDPAVVQRTADTALEVGGGRVDVLVNNAGDYRPNGRFVTTSEADWDALYAINLQHVFRLTRAVLPAMVEQRSGSIVNVSTVEAFRGIPGNVVYSAFNAGVSAFTRSLAVEVGRDGIRVNAIAPDMADTLQTPAEWMLRGRDPELVGCWIPVGRFGAPADYAEVVLFLAGDASRFVTGHTIPVDGGTLAASGWFGRPGRKGFTNTPDRP